MTDCFHASSIDGSILVTDNYSAALLEMQGKELCVELNDGPSDATESGWLRAGGSISAALPREDVKRLRDWLNAWLERD